ncbi:MULTISPECIES: phosphomethylpyrimidine synthase ThiC [unclassified Carboxydocella]|uniref:phosphomethylpyrimidine synthase ThiC n=1 Tax=unclassified Carboxydocella TaxID=2685367 RepID=UPI0009AC3244|nr:MULTISPECIES: phosphomethylpyrimidine synthase ThiC [unclassified Carboxydocella]GAW27900.1 phosphomethylpyrimidine synthase [Carboxydocella sp. ULO1]GAW31505.1 phosphomethylpyrimidine synthase [Carboxydocella sp. JDF658]
MTSVLENASQGQITSTMEFVASQENITKEELARGIARGEIVILNNRNHKNIKPVGVGYPLSAKVNASIGTLKHFINHTEEIEKLKNAEAAGADTIMDLSSGGTSQQSDEFRRNLIRETSLPVGTLPLYQALIEAREKYGSCLKMSASQLFETIEKQAEDGISFMGFHCSLNQFTLDLYLKQNRQEPIVSYGGTFLTAWMLEHKKENPLYEHYDKLLKILKKHDIVLSLADAFRPGSVHDSLDTVQTAELAVIGYLVKRARDFGVQVQVKGPGHTPIQDIHPTINLMKKLTSNSPYFVFGPIVTDIAPGYDHLTSAIGGALAVAAGADFICYVTPAEHVAFPTVEHVYAGVEAAKKAARFGDHYRLQKGRKGK